MDGTTSNTTTTNTSTSGGGGSWDHLDLAHQLLLDHDLSFDLFHHHIPLDSPTPPSLHHHHNNNQLQQQQPFLPGGQQVHGGGTEEVREEEDEDGRLGAMKEMMYKIAAMQPVDIDPATIRKPKRRNVRISDDPQSVAARHRRERISERIRILQRLVPGGTKMDTASMLDEAIRYVKFLKRQVQELQQQDAPPPPPMPPHSSTVQQPSLGGDQLAAVWGGVRMTEGNIGSSPSTSTFMGGGGPSQGLGLGFGLCGEELN